MYRPVIGINRQRWLKRAAPKVTLYRNRSEGSLKIQPLTTGQHTAYSHHSVRKYVFQKRKGTKGKNGLTIQNIEIGIVE